MNEERETFYVDPEIVRDPGVPNKPKMVYLAVASYADEDRVATVTRRMIADTTGYAVRTIDYANRAGEEYGLFTIDREVRSANTYRLRDFGRGYIPIGVPLRPPKQAQKRTTISASLRLEVITRDQARCRYCGKPVDLRSAHLDHVVPWSEGGTKSLENLVLACAPCNYAKGNKRWEPLPIPNL